MYFVKKKKKDSEKIKLHLPRKKTPSLGTDLNLPILVTSLISLFLTRMSMKVSSASLMSPAACSFLDFSAISETMSLNSCVRRSRRILCFVAMDRQALRNVARKNVDYMEGKGLSNVAECFHDFVV